MFAILGVAIWLRSFSYAYWAACVTAILSLLYAYFGREGVQLLGIRLEGIALGAAIGIIVSWYLLPVRTSAVARKRIAAAKKALAEARRDPAKLPQFEHAMIQLDQIAPTLRWQRRLGRPELADAVDHLRTLVVGARL